jgi:hypothetical protein
MTTTDDELIRQLRAELDELVSNVPDAGPLPVAIRADDAHDRRWLVLPVAAATLALVVGGLVLLANRHDDERGLTPLSPSAPVATGSETSVGDARTTAAPDTTAAPGTSAAPETSAPVTTAPVVRPPAEYETITPVLETSHRGVQLCLGEWTIGTTPPTCVGPNVRGWSWDAVEGEQSASGATWTEAYVAGAWDPQTQVFTVSEARPPTDADRSRFHAETPQPDFSVPCPEPAGGWPARNQEWPGEQIHMLPGYAGWWEDPTHQVVIVKFTGDLEAAEAAVRRYYNDALCVIPAQHSMDELVRISNELVSMSSTQFLWSNVYADATGEWVEAGVIVADPERQAALDEQYGPGLVRLTPRLRPI